MFIIYILLVFSRKCDRATTAACISHMWNRRNHNKLFNTTIIEFKFYLFIYLIIQLK